MPMTIHVRLNRSVVAIAAITLLSAIISGCAPLPEISMTADSIVIFPPPPDTTRIQFLTKISDSTDIKKRRSRFASLFFDSETAIQILKPYGIASSPGRLYVCDTELGGLYIIDLEERTFEPFVPKGLGAFQKPINAFVDDSGTLYVADRDRGQILLFDNDLRFRSTIGDPSTLTPTDVFVYDGKTWVTDLSGRQVKVFDTVSGDSLFSIPGESPDSLEFLSQPTNLYIRDDLVYVSDFGDNTVKVYTTQGQYVRRIGGIGRALGKFARPKGVAVDKEGLLYAVDAAFENVQMFDDLGNLLMFFGGSYSGPGYMWLPAKVAIDYDNVGYFQQYVFEAFELEYLIYVTNQFGPDKISVYGYVRPRSVSDVLP